MDVGADVLAIGIEHPVAAVESHSDPERRPVRPRLFGQAPLGVDSGSDGIGRPAEHRDEGVALGLLLVAVDRPDRRPNQLAMTRQEGGPSLAAQLLG
jgi:hypothetical protein